MIVQSNRIRNDFESSVLRDLEEVSLHHYEILGKYEECIEAIHTNKVYNDMVDESVQKLTKVLT